MLLLLAVLAALDETVECRLWSRLLPLPRVGSSLLAKDFMSAPVRWLYT